MTHMPIITDALVRLSPLVCHGENLLAKTPGTTGCGALVTAAGSVHLLRALGGQDMLRVHLLSARRVELLRQAAALYRGLATPETVHTVTWFLLICGASQSSNDQQPEVSSVTSNSVLQPSGSLLEEVVEHIPWVTLPEPSMLWLGRIWLLENAIPERGRFQVLIGDRVFQPSGAFIRLCTWEVQVFEVIERYLNAATSTLARAVGLELDAVIIEHTRRFADTGFLESGELLLLSGPKLGLILPPHYSRAFGRRVHGDVAIATEPRPLSSGGTIAVYERAGSRWEPRGRSICLGTRQAHVDVANPLSYLHWVAARVIQNEGRFHEAD